jgi:hypothetical protein
MTKWQLIKQQMDCNHYSLSEGERQQKKKKKKKQMDKMTNLQNDKLLKWHADKMTKC